MCSVWRGSPPPLTHPLTHPLLWLNRSLVCLFFFPLGGLTSSASSSPSLFLLMCPRATLTCLPTSPELYSASVSAPQLPENSNNNEKHNVKRAKEQLMPPGNPDGPMFAGL